MRMKAQLSSGGSHWLRNEVVGGYDSSSEGGSSSAGETPNATTPFSPPLASVAARVAAVMRAEDLYS